MAESGERVMLVTIRVTHESDGSPVIVAREHLLWPLSHDDGQSERSTVGSRPDRVVATVHGWLAEFVGG